MRLFAWVALSVFLSGCVTPAWFMPEPGPCQPSDVPEPKAYPPIYLQVDGEIQLLEYRSGSGAYAVVARHAEDGTPYGMAVVGDELYASWSDRLVRFDQDLDVLKSRSGTFGGLDALDGSVWVAGKGRLDAYDAGLRPVGGVAFKAGTDKVSHDVLVCPPYVLLLDNVVVPIYLYQVDIRDPDAPTALQEEEMSCLCHLRAQWVDREASEWYVLESGGGWGTAYQELHTYAIGGESKRSVKTFESRSDMQTGDSVSVEGWAVSAVAPTDPPVAVAWKDGRHWLGTLIVDEEGLVLGGALDLKVDGERRADVGFDVRGDRAVVVINGELRLIDLSPTPTIIHSRIVLDEPMPVQVAIG